MTRTRQRPRSVRIASPDSLTTSIDDGAVVVGSRAYDFMYRFWAPWDAVGVRDELRAVLDGGVVTPRTHPRAVDLGCGTGANVVELARRGFDAHGLDFSGVALQQAGRRAEAAGVADRTRFVQGDLTADAVEGMDGPFDLIVDFGTLDDLRPAGRAAMARLITRWSRPGSVVLFWCFYAARQQLPWVSLHGPSRMAPAVEPGEERRLFGEAFDIRPGPQPQASVPAACFLMTRKG